ncbi:MAG: ribose 5-phosphate isomerase B [Kiritimatiellae bacterium]|nr:ribose 5-phosphate isomerase B [Kiritimatiellia bacterium]
MKIALGNDHGGFKIKAALLKLLRQRGIEVDDCGTFDTQSVDYSDYAREVCERVVDGRAGRGILLCTTGTGMAIAANRFSGVRAAVCDTPDRAARGRSHNDINVLVLAGAIISPEEAAAIAAAWLDTPFDGGERHARRLQKIERAGRLSEIALLGRADPEVHAAIVGHTVQEDTTINLIASENYVSRAVREAQGSVLTNKYSEGYPGKRWYSGCRFVDDVERLAIERAKALFGAEHVNVQPHCGSSANMAVYFAMLQPGDTIMAMSLDQGGHLTHGSPVNFSGRLFNIVSYKVSERDERLDYDAIEAQALACKPKLIVAGGSAYPRTLDFTRFRAIADRAGALLMVDMAHIAGLIAGGVHPSPVPLADFVTSTTHKTLRGPRSGLIICREKYAQAIDKTVFPGLQGGPLQHTTAAKAVCFREALQPDFRDYAAQIVANARRLAEALSGHGFRLVSGGTDTHLMLVNVGASGLTGKDAAAALDRAGIIGNKNAIPFDTKSPFVTSGVRLGTASATTRGMREPEMERIAGWIAEVLNHVSDEALQVRIRQEVAGFARAFAVP